MTFCQGDKLHGFTITRVRECSELSGRLVELVFDKTGTEVCWVDNAQSNKLFCIAFKTLPEDSTGVFHILEHSVLCGSDKYPVKEPFVELAKSSMNTFLNAMTFQDKTIYPVSSRVDEDFLNLSSVYLDAVFAPAILHDPNIFYQEGWHIEEGEDGLSYKGVVFNEMKGAMSDVESAIGDALLQMMYPDSPYGFNSGGDPEVIPDLTYEKFVETYRRFYHPSNARVFLDGAIPVDETFALLESYLTRFEKSEALPVIVPQKPVTVTGTSEFELGEEEEIENRGHVTVAKFLGTWEEKTKNLAVGILCDALCGSNESPVKRVVLGEGLAQDISMDVDDSCMQTSLAIHAENVMDGKEELLLQRVYETLEKQISDGLDYETLEASINHSAYCFREPEEPAALFRCIRALGGWLHGGDPLREMCFDEDIAALRVMLKEHAFETLLREILPKGEGTVTLFSKPSRTLGAQKREKETARLAKIASERTEEERQKNVELNARLTEWQEGVDTPEQLTTIPVLDVTKISREPNLMKTIMSEQENVKVIYHPAACHGITHISLYFKLTDLNLEQLMHFRYINSFLGQLATEYSDAIALDNRIKNVCGRFSVELFTAKHQKDPQHATPYLRVAFSALDENLSKAYELVAEIMRHTDFSAKDRIRELILQLDESRRQAAVQSGHAIALRAACAGLTAESAVSEYTSGHTYSRWVHKVATEFDAMSDSVIEELKTILSNACVRARMTVSVTSSEPKNVSSLISMFEEGTSVADKAHYEMKMPHKLGLVIPAQVGFAVQAYCFDSFPDVSMRVMCNILTYGYLWNKVRVQGGAYGTGLSTQREGMMYTYSYRDPSPANAIEVNKGLAEYIREFVNSGERIDKYIISSIADTEPLASARMEGLYADIRYICGITDEDERSRRAKILETTSEKLLACTEMLDTFAGNGSVCVVGYEAQLKEIEDIEIEQI